MGGGSSQEPLHPPPKGVTPEGERNREKKMRGKLLLFFSYPMGGVNVVQEVTVTNKE